MPNAIVLAGGRSSRFGSDKAFTKMGGSTIVGSLIALLRLSFPRVIVVTNYPEKYQVFPVQIVSDQVKGLGPLIGIYSGLLASEAERNFITACDMPLLNHRLVRHLASIEEGDIVVPRINDKVEPLHAVYSKACLPAIEQQIAARDYKIQNFFSRVSVKFVDEPEIRKFDPSLASFLNINLQKDLKKIKDLVRTDV